MAVQVDILEEMLRRNDWRKAAEYLISSSVGLFRLGDNSNDSIGVNANPANGGSSNVCVGDGAGASLTTGGRNVMVGKGAGTLATSAFDTVAVGQAALSALTTGLGNFAVGSGTLTAVTSDTGNTALGNGAGAGITGSSNVAIGGASGGTAGARSNATMVGASCNATASGALAAGKGTTASAAGAFAIGTNSIGSGATSAVANQGVVGTVSHTIVMTKQCVNGGITAGALPTATLSSGVGAQITTSRNVVAVTPVTFSPTGVAAATCLVELSPDNTTYSSLGTWTIPAGATSGVVQLIALPIPCKDASGTTSWYLRLTTTNATLGTTTFY